MTFHFAPLVLVAALAGPGAAFAQDNHNSMGNYFAPGQPVIQTDNDSTIGLVQTNGPATLDVYALRGNERGLLIQSISLNAGTNGDVELDLGVAPPQYVQAVLMVDGLEVAAKSFSVDNS